MSEPNTPDGPTGAPIPITRTRGVPTEQHRLLARLYIREGKSFRQAAIEAGFSENTAIAGPAEMMSRTPSVRVAIEEETRHIPQSEELKAQAIRVLAQDLQNGRSRGLERTIETLGKMRIYDWFVRHSETQIGIFMGISESTPTHADDTIEVYPE